MNIERMNIVACVFCCCCFSRVTRESIKMSGGNPPSDVQFGAYFYETPEWVLGPDCALALSNLSEP